LAAAAARAGEDSEPGIADEEEPERTTARLPRRDRGETRVPPVPAASTASTAAADDDTAEAPARRLPSRRPGAALAGGPLAAGPIASGPLAAGTPAGGPLSGDVGSVPPLGPSPFAASASAPPPPADPASAPVGNGTSNGAATGAGAPARAGGGFGMPGRPFTAGTPAGGRRAAGAGGPSAATAAAAAAAARAARSGGASTTASALFTARGPADADTSAQNAGPASNGTSNGTSNGASAPGEDADAPPATTTGSVPGRPESPAAPAAWDHGPAVEAARRSGSGAVDAVPEPVVPDADAAADVDVESGSSSERVFDDEPVAAAPAPLEAPARPETPERDETSRPVEEPAREEAPARVEEPVPVPAAAAAAPGGTPIFDTVSMWFSTDSPAGERERVIDLRDRPEATSRTPASRWSSLGDQRWLATNARAAANPEVAGTTEVGLPRRRPGANLIPSAAAAAPMTAPAARAEPVRRAPAPAAVGGRPVDAGGRTDADAVRGRLSSYQRGLTSARRARHLPADRSSDGLFTAPRGGENDPGRTPGEQGG